eukprot:scaffold2621_cov124-Isochrysis_galbana.AAC.9
MFQRYWGYFEFFCSMLYKKTYITRRSGTKGAPALAHSVTGPRRQDEDEEASKITQRAPRMFRRILRRTPAGSDQRAGRPKIGHRNRKSKISLKQKSTATLRSPCAGPAQGPAQGAGSSGPCTLHPAEHPRRARGTRHMQSRVRRI